MNNAYSRLRMEIRLFTRLLRELGRSLARTWADERRGRRRMRYVERERLHVAWEPHNLTAQEFAAVEVQRETKDLPSWENPEKPQIVEVIADPATTDAYYHYPRSGLEYYIRVRLVKNIGAEQVASRWTTVVMSVDYWPLSFVKDTENPMSHYAAFPAEHISGGALEEDAPTTAFVPWGQAAYSHDITVARLRSGTISAEFYEDPTLPDSAEQRYEVMRRIAHRRRPICILEQAPDPEKVFAMIVGKTSSDFRPPDIKIISFPYQETTNYSEGVA